MGKNLESYYAISNDGMYAIGCWESMSEWDDFNQDKPYKYYVEYEKSGEHWEEIDGGAFWNYETPYDLVCDVMRANYEEIYKIEISHDEFSKIMEDAEEN